MEDPHKRVKVAKEGGIKKMCATYDKAKLYPAASTTDGQKMIILMGFGSKPEMLIWIARNV